MHLLFSIYVVFAIYVVSLLFYCPVASASRAARPFLGAPLCTLHFAVKEVGALGRCPLPFELFICILFSDRRQS